MSKQYGAGIKAHRQWNRIKNSKINPHIYIKLIFNKGAKKTHGKKLVCSINGDGKTG